jgi:hypothetical protein
VVIVGGVLITDLLVVSVGVNPDRASRPPELDPPSGVHSIPSRPLVD